MKYCENYENGMSKCYWKNDFNRHAQHRVATHIQFVKMLRAVKQSTIKRGIPVLHSSPDIVITHHINI